MKYPTSPEAEPAAASRMQQSGGSPRAEAGHMLHGEAPVPAKCNRSLLHRIAADRPLPQRCGTEQMQLNPA